MARRGQALRKARAVKKPAKPAVDLKQENAALKRELAQALEQQTATAEVLQVINSSPGDLAPVFDAILEKAHSLCGVSQGSLQLYDGETFRAVAVHGLSKAFEDRLRQGFSPNVAGRRLLEGARFVHIPDLAESDDPMARAAVELSGVRTALFIPLRKDGTLLGRISASRREVKPFAEKEIALLESFAAQTVIAIENTRLLNEQREALERQTATAEVLQVINQSPGDLAPVFDAMLDKALGLCEAAFGILWTYDGGQMHAAALRGVPPAYADFLTRGPHAVGEDNAHARLLRGERIVHIVEAAEDKAYRSGDALRHATVELGGSRTLLAVPLRKDNAFLGDFVIYRQEVKSFSDKQVGLLENFAAQAVIAMENARLLTETKEALEQQTATAEVLGVINSSPGDLAPVFDAVLGKAIGLCDAAFGMLTRFDGECFQAVALHGVPPGFAEFWSQPRRSTPGLAHYRLTEGENVVQVGDISRDDLYISGNPFRRALGDLGGARTVLWVALRKDDALLGSFVIYRQEVRPFTEKQIALLQSFAAQAVIAMENARLIRETREALDQQTASAEILRVISGSTTDVQPVFEAIIARAGKLCEAEFSAVARFDDDGLLRLVAVSNLSADEAKAFHSLFPRPPTHGFVMGRAFVEGRTVHVEDVLADPDYEPRTREILQSLTGYRTFLGVPILRDGKPIGVIGCGRRAVRPFTPAQIDLVTTFADQAVIAIENARLFDELRERTGDLEESLEYQTATSDVLQVISRSTFDLEPVLNTLIETAARLCQAEMALVHRREGEAFRMAANCGFPAEFDSFMRSHSISADRGTMVGRVALDGKVVHVTDCAADPEYRLREAITLARQRTALGVPLLREGQLIGVIVLARDRVEPFTERQIELVRTFADQAVIAIENTRLLTELRERQAELRVTFDNMGDGVAMFDAAARLAAWNRNLQEMLDLPDAVLDKRPNFGELFRYLAERGEFGSADLEAELARSLEDTSREMRYERNRPDGRIIEVRRNRVPGGGFVLIYADITERKRAEEAIRTARDAAEMALRELQTAQASLVHAQKMAALGQLTAGIAHEIKNPLNFVNNFAGLSVELLDELKEATTRAIGSSDANERAEIVETIGMLTSNLAKIAEHGRRADGIVKSMLQHSRGGSGERQPADLNALVEEALNLAYHGARAQDQSFNITMERDLDRNLAPIEVVPQDVMRVFLNLVGNGFYAANKRSREGESTFRPVLTVTTREFGDAVEIRVRDNGVGIAAEHREKLFQPFFTTKPTGEGTGLGLSISYEIVTQQHGGTITVGSEAGQFTEFTVRLPRRGHSAAGRVV